MCVEIVDYIPNFSSDKSMGHDYSKKKQKGKIDRKIFNEMQAMVNEQNTKILTVFPLIMNSSHYNFYN